MRLLQDRVEELETRERRLVAELEDANARLVQVAAASGADAAGVPASHRDAQSERLRQRVAELEGDLAAARRALRQRDADREEVVDDGRDSSSRGRGGDPAALRAALQEAAAAKREAAALREELATAHQRSATLEAQLRAAEADCVRAEERVVALQGEARGLRGENAKLREELSAFDMVRLCVRGAGSRSDALPQNFFEEIEDLKFRHSELARENEALRKRLQVAGGAAGVAR